MTGAGSLGKSRSLWRESSLCSGTILDSQVVLELTRMVMTGVLDGSTTQRTCLNWRAVRIGKYLLAALA
jgi:hypothetical protein